MNNNYNKQLPEVFKELKEAQKIQISKHLKEREYYKKHKLHKVAEALKDYLIGTRFEGINIPAPLKKIDRLKLNKKDTRNNSYISDINNHKDTSIYQFNAIGLIIGLLFLLLFFAIIKSNYSFAVSHEEEKKAIGNYEENKNPINLMEILSENISEVIKKEISIEEEIIKQEVVYIENNQLPKDEQIVVDNGYDGLKEVTYIRSYENEELKDEKIVAEHITLEPAKKYIQVGTSDFLLEKNIHIGDTIYTIQEIFLLDKPEESGEIICKIYQYIDVVLEEVLDGWCKIEVDGFEGYIPENAVTSATIEPSIVETSRIQRIMVRVKFDMELNKPSGLKKEDFIKILSNNSQDTNKIFEENAGLFYEIEQKYNINGILIAAIGIHESAWGTSKIANDKKNLFGYGAYDSSPYSSAFSFESYSEGIELLAKVLTKYYLNEVGTEIYDGETAIGSFYNGSTVSGINVRYASDPEWGTKVFDKMQMLYDKLKN